MLYKKIILPLIALVIVTGFENCKAKSCDSETNVNERKRMKTSNGVFSKKEQRRMKR